jgi:hypothetical protein
MIGLIKKKDEQVLIIALALALILAVTYFIFSGYTVSPGLLGSGCYPSSKFFCSNQTINTNGQISFTFSQNTNKSMYNVYFACVIQNGTQTVMPKPTEFNNTTIIGTSTLFSNKTVYVTKLICYNTNGTVISIRNLTKPLFLTIWLKYTNATSSKNFNIAGVAVIRIT